MRFKQLIVLTYAITAAALAFGLMSSYTRNLRNEMYQSIKDRETTPQQSEVAAAPPAVEMTTVVTAARDLPLGYRLKKDDLTQIEWPAAAVPKGAYATVSEVFSEQKEPVLKRDLFASEVLLNRKIMPNSGQSALALMLPADKRAVTIKVNEIRGVGGFVQPGDKVDVLLTEKQDDSERVTEVLLQNIQVMAIGQEIGREDHQPKVTNSVTVAVSLEDAQRLALAETVGYLTLALRSPTQPVRQDPRGVATSDLKSRRVKAKSPVAHVQIYRAAKAFDYKIPSSQ